MYGVANPFTCTIYGVRVKPRYDKEALAFQTWVLELLPGTILVSGARN